MEHLTFDQIERYLEGDAPEWEAHVAACDRCRKQITVSQRLTRALTQIERVAPTAAFSERMERLAASPPAGARPAPPPPRALAPYRTWTGLAALVAVLLLLVFAYQTAVAFQDGGALDFVSLFASRPDLLSTYPAESLNALVESLPLVGLALTLGLLVVALVLTQDFIALPLLRNRD